MLTDVLEWMAETPFVDGKTDCVLVVADWLMLSGYADAAAPWRGRYHTALGRARLLKREGGIEAVMIAGAKRIGLKETATPLEGDVGLVRLSGQDQAAICLGDLWAAKGRGLVVAEPEVVLRAWAV